MGPLCQLWSDWWQNQANVNWVKFFFLNFQCLFLYGCFLMDANVWHQNFHTLHPLPYFHPYASAPDPLEQIFQLFSYVSDKIANPLASAKDSAYILTLGHFSLHTMCVTKHTAQRSSIGKILPLHCLLGSPFNVAVMHPLSIFELLTFPKW